jgi:hypothetical protein
MSMMPKLAAATPLVAVLVVAALQAQEPALQLGRFAGTWVGTQAWALNNPPPGSSQDQPVTLTLEVVEGKVVGAMVPFLGGEEGATIVDSTIVGDELRATAIVGKPRPQAGGRRGGGPPGWKESIRVAFVFRNDGVTMNGTADVRLGDVPWIAFKYALGKKRNRY